MKKQMAMLLALILSFASASCAKMEEAAPFITETAVWYADFDGAPLTFTMEPDGSYTLALPHGLGKPIVGTWVYDDGFLRLDDDEVTLDVAGENLLIWHDENVFFTHEEPALYAPAEVMADAPLGLFAGYWVCQYVDVNGLALPARVMDDRTDLYIEGHSGILGGPRFGDTQVKFTFADGALTCEHAGAQVTLQIQQDGYLRLTLAAPDASKTLYLTSAPTPDEADNDAP